MVDLGQGKIRRYFAFVINGVVINIFDGSRFERSLSGKAASASGAVLHGQNGTAAQYRKGKRPAKPRLPNPVVIALTT